MTRRHSAFWGWYTVWRWVSVALLCLGWGMAQDASSQNTLSHAVEMHQKGDYGAAIAGYQDFLKAHPEAAAVRSNLGAALAHEGRLTEAIREYKLALGADPNNQGVRFNLALAYYKTGDLAPAVSEFETVRSALPAGDDQGRRVAVLLADCYLRQGDEKRVIELLDPIAAANPDDLGSAYLLGIALLHENQEERGKPLIERILRTGDTAEAHMLMAFTRMKSNDHKAALAEAVRAIELNPKLPDAYNLQGRILFLISDLAGAEQAFRRALAIDASSFEPLLFLGALLREQGRLPEARESLGRALTVRPGEVRARYQFAILEAAEGHDDRAASRLQALVKDFPEYTEAHRSLSTIYFRLGRTADGRREQEIAEKMNAQLEAGSQALGRTLK